MVFVAGFTKQPKFMANENKPLRIIGNESNRIYQMEPDNNTQSQKPEASSEERPEQAAANPVNNNLPPYSNDLATNDGAVVETLDTAFHNKPGVAEGENPSGSDRADYYEVRADGKSDAEEEVNG